MLPDSDLRCELEASSSLYSLWLVGGLVDAELVAGDGTVVPAHQVVLASASAFFRALFTGMWRQQHPPLSGGLPRFTLTGVDGASLQLLLHAVYSRRLPLTAEGAAEEAAALLGAANYLEVLPVKAACCRLLRGQLSLETVAHTLALAAAHDCADLLADACRFFEGHFQQLLKSQRAAASLAVLPPDLLRDLLASDGLNLGSELDVARAALLWAAADLPQRAPLLAELLPAARLPPQQLLAAAAAGGLAGPAGDALLQLPAELQAWSAAAAGGRHEQHPQPPSTPRQGGAERAQLGTAFVAACQQLRDSEASAAVACSGGREAAVVAYRPRLSCPTGLLMAGGLDDGWRPLRTVELYDTHRDCWAPGPVMPAPCQFAAAALVGGQTLVVEGAAHAPHVLAFDRQARRWEQRTPPSTPRVNMAVAALEGQLFVLGGRAGIGKGAAVLTEVETFDPATDSWRRAAPMCTPRTSLAAAALGGRLYAVGGQDGRSTHDSCEWFEPGMGRWLPLGARLAQPRKYLGLAAAGGRLIAVGGMTGARMRLHTAEALDPREGRWQPLPPMSSAASSCGAAALHGSVYVVGGNVGQEIHENHAGVEAWVEAAGRWRPCAGISHGRSGLSVAPF